MPLECESSDPPNTAYSCLFFPHIDEVKADVVVGYNSSKVHATVLRRLEKGMPFLVPGTSLESGCSSGEISGHFPLIK